MFAAAVGALHDQVIDRRQRLGIANDGQAGTADVAGEGEASAAPSVSRIDGRRTEDVAGVVGLHRQLAVELVGVR